jgi:undecaprenyl-diphosphatase
VSTPQNAAARTLSPELPGINSGADHALLGEPLNAVTELSHGAAMPAGRSTWLAGALAVFAASALVPSSVQYPVLRVINTLAGRSPAFDIIINAPTAYPLFAGVILVAGVWYCWFAKGAAVQRSQILAGIVAACCVGIVSRLLQLTLPTHLRPLHDPALGFRAPFGVNPENLNHWNAWPSDTSALLVGIAAVIHSANPRLGRAAFAFAAVLCLCRVYLGLHFPADIVGGAALGILAVGTAQHPAFIGAAGRVLDAARERAGLFYAAFFLLSYGAATLFDDVREFASQAMRLVRTMHG